MQQCVRLHNRLTAAEINELLARAPHLTYTDIGDLLTPTSREIFGQLPVQIQLELLLERDTHGNVQIRGIVLLPVGV